MKFHIMITDGVFMKKWLLLPLLKMKILFMILQDSLKNLGLQKLVSWKINTLTGEPNGGEATNPSAVYQVSSNADFKKVLTFASLGGVTFYDESGLASMTLTWLQIQYSDEIGQKPYAISVRGGFTGVSELNTMLWSGKFQNGVINATYQAQFKIDGVIRNFKWRIQGAHI